MEAKHMKNKMSTYMADELLNRVKHLHKALCQAENIIAKLEQENTRLQDALVSLASENNTGYVLDSEAFNESVYTV
jgi:hypothetical protein